MEMDHRRKIRGKGRRMMFRCREGWLQGGVMEVYQNRVVDL